MAAGEKYGITPYGTEAMHVLRAEKGYIIAGQDTDGTVTPQDLGMEWIVSNQKPDFLGKRSLARADIARDDRKQLVGLLPEDPRALLEEGAQIVAEPGEKNPGGHDRPRHLELSQPESRTQLRARDGQARARAARPEAVRADAGPDDRGDRDRPGVHRQGGRAAPCLSPSRDGGHRGGAAARHPSLRAAPRQDRAARRPGRSGLHGRGRPHARRAAAERAEHHGRKGRPHSTMARAGCLAHDLPAGRGRCARRQPARSPGGRPCGDHRCVGRPGRAAACRTERARRAGQGLPARSASARLRSRPLRPKPPGQDLGADPLAGR